MELDTLQVLGTLRVMDELVLDPNTDDKSHRKDALQCLCFVNENDEKRSIQRTLGMVLLVKRNVPGRSSIPWIIHNKAMINWPFYGEVSNYFSNSHILFPICVYIFFI